MPPSRPIFMPALLERRLMVAQRLTSENKNWQDYLAFPSLPLCALLKAIPFLQTQPLPDTSHRSSALWPAWFPRKPYKPIGFPGFPAITLCLSCTGPFLLGMYPHRCFSGASISAYVLTYKLYMSSVGLQVHPTSFHLLTNLDSFCPCRSAPPFCSLQPS